MPILQVIMAQISRYIGRNVGLYVGKEAALALVMIRRAIRRMTIGASLILVGALISLGSFGFLILALFFYLGQLDPLIVPALWTGVISLGIGLIVAILGLTFLRQSPLR